MTEEKEYLKFHLGSLTCSAQALGRGPIVLCLHGFPDTASSFRHQLPALAKSGYRAISLTLRGYEPSSLSPDRDYSLEAIAGDVIGVVEQLGSGPVHLIGHDWGAAAAYMVGAAAPQKFKSLVTLAVPHSGRFAREGLRVAKQLRLSWYMGLFNLPIISDYIVRQRDYAFIRKLWNDWSPNWKPDPGVLEDVISSLRQPGVTSAVLSYYRAALSLAALTASSEEAHFLVPVPTLSLSGAADGCISSAVFEDLMVDTDFPKGMKFHRVEGAGHFLHQEVPEQVNPIILDWIEAND